LHGKFVGRLVGDTVLDSEPSAETAFWEVVELLFEPHRAHNPYYEPRTPYARKTMLQRFIFVNLSKGRES
jgi:hypothetical protein